MNLNVTQEQFFDESQENGGYGDPRVTAPEFVIDEEQENGSYVASKVASPREVVIDESQEKGGL